MRPKVFEIDNTTTVVAAVWTFRPRTTYVRSDILGALVGYSSGPSFTRGGQYSPYIQMHLATCQMLGLSCPGGPKNVGMSTNSAAMAAAEALVTEDQLALYQSEGHVISLAEDDVTAVGNATAL